MPNEKILFLNSFLKREPEYYGAKKLDDIPMKFIK